MPKPRYRSVRFRQSVRVFSSENFLIYTEESEIISQKDLEDAQKALLDAKARHALRNSIVESVLIANPILKAVHAGSNASPIER